MKRKALILGLLILIGICIVVFFTLQNPNFKGIGPALKPPAGDIADRLENQLAGEDIDFPLALPPSFKISLFAKGVGNARVLKFDPTGNLVVSQPNSGKVVALVDKNKDGKSDETKVIVEQLNRPHGLAFNDGYLLVAETDKVSRFHYSNLTATGKEVLFNLPGGGGHSSRTIEFGKDNKLYTTIGSSCNACVEKDNFRAKMLVSEADGKDLKVFAQGLRNTVFFEPHPQTGELWGTDMGRDLLGDNTPPDDLNIIKEGHDYGWPYCYGQKIHDSDFDPKKEHSCKDTTPPVFEFPAHSAPLGLAFINSKNFNPDWEGDLLVSFHGSWNRSVPTGYKIVHLKVENNTITQSQDFISGWLEGDSSLGRPVDLVFDSEGRLFISDDKAGVVYLVTSNP